MVRLKLALLWIYMFCIVSEISGQDSSEVVLQDTTRVIGQVITWEKNRNVVYEAFTGIPYAKPPVGSLRFKPPVSLEYSDTKGFIDARILTPICLQQDFMNINLRPNDNVLGQEDCLYLNIYRPSLSVPNHQLPVMVFIHGVAFLLGSSNQEMLGPQLFMESQKVILVTINYRLGALGFMSTETEEIAGNMGLKDQNMALKWVKENIASFGGNPNLITIFGQSVGGTSVIFHMISRHSKGLFHRAISQSGPFLNSPLLHQSESPAFYSYTLSQKLGCEASYELLECLQRLEAKNITKMQGIFEGVPFIPINDFKFSTDPFFDEDTQEALKNGNIHDVPLLIGANQDEAVFLMLRYLTNQTSLDELNSNFDIKGPNILLGIDDASVSDEDSGTARLFLLHYTNEDNANFSIGKNMDELQNMIGDAMFIGPNEITVESLRRSSMKSSIYYYSYRYQGRFSLVNMLGFPNNSLGVCHGDELLLMFIPSFLINITYNQEDKKMSEKLINIWTSFSIAGDPGWKPVSVNLEVFPTYAILDAGPIRTTREDGFSKRMAFFKSIQTLLNAYKNLDVENHPMIKKIRNEKEEL